VVYTKVKDSPENGGLPRCDFLGEEGEKSPSGRRLRTPSGGRKIQS